MPQSAHADGRPPVALLVLALTGCPSAEPELAPEPRPPPEVACRPEIEAYKGMDDDCDGAIDDGFLSVAEAATSDNVVYVTYPHQI